MEKQNFFDQDQEQQECILKQIFLQLLSQNELEESKKNIPKSWDESLKELQMKYELNLQLAEQIFDSKYINLFEKILEKSKVNPTFVASVFCSSITNLERNGLDSNY